jgi:uncharacterized membrane protein
MLNNKRGQMMLYGLILMMFIFVIVVVLIFPMRSIISNFRIERHCTWTNLSINDRALCTIVDMYLPYFMLTLLIGSAAYLFYRTTLAA